jgi:thioredoxin-like negative regulator of GroEL
MSFTASSEIGNVFVQTTHNRGFTTEEIAERAANKLLQVETKEALMQVLIKYLREAQESERNEMRKKLLQVGHKDAANYIGDL